MKVAARILVGSQNYSLSGPDSDYDYKLLMVPSFDDLYNYHKVDKHDLPQQYDPEHYSVISVMTFDKNVRAGNVNALEMLFSSEKKFYSSSLADYFFLAMMRYENGYIRDVWDNFYKTLRGITMNSIDRYGMTRKAVSRAIYFISLAQYIATHDFSIRPETWRAYDVVAAAYNIRFENGSLPTKSRIVELLDSAEEFSKKLCTHKSYYENDEFLKNYMKNFVQEEIFHAIQKK